MGEARARSLSKHVGVINSYGQVPTGAPEALALAKASTLAQYAKHMGLPTATVSTVLAWAAEAVVAMGESSFMVDALSRSVCWGVLEGGLCLECATSAFDSEVGWIKDHFCCAHVLERSADAHRFKRGIFQVSTGAGDEPPAAGVPFARGPVPIVHAPGSILEQPIGPIPLPTDNVGKLSGVPL